MGNFNQSNTDNRGIFYRLKTITDDGVETLDGLYGPWNSFDSFYKATFGFDVNDDNDLEFIIGSFNSIDAYYDYCLSQIKVGLTIGIVENDKVVEYWKPVEGEGFVQKFVTSSGTESGGVSEEVIKEIRKEIEDNEFVVATALNDLNSRLKNLTAAERVDTYSSALVLATNENIGKIVNVIGNDTVEGILHLPGLYIVTGVNKLLKLEGIGGSGDSSTILQYLDDISVDENDNSHKYISSLKKSEGSIVPIMESLDTNKILMNGDEEDDNDDFLTVTGVTVGNFKNGDKISKGTSLETFIRKMLQKEIDVVANKPTVSLKGHPSGTTYEIGTSLSGTLSYTFNQGYFSGANSAYVTNQPANCSDSEVSYSPSETYDITVGSGNNNFEVSVKYTANTKIPKTNMGNNSNVNITAGTATDSKSVVGKYKIWLGTSTIDYTAETSMTDAIKNDLLSIEKARWEDEKPTIIEIRHNYTYYAVIPALSSDKTITFDLGPGGGCFYKMFDFLYALPNGETKSYTVLYTKAEGTLTNLNWNNLKI